MGKRVQVRGVFSGSGTPSKRTSGIGKVLGRKNFRVVGSKSRSRAEGRGAMKKEHKKGEKIKKKGTIPRQKEWGDRV